MRFEENPFDTLIDVLREWKRTWEHVLILQYHAEWRFVARTMYGHDPDRELINAVIEHVRQTRRVGDEVGRIFARLGFLAGRVPG